MNSTIRTLGGSKGCRVGPGRARISATRAQGCWFPRCGVEHLPRRIVRWVRITRVVHPRGPRRAADKIVTRSEVSVEGIGREIS